MILETGLNMTGDRALQEQGTSPLAHSSSLASFQSVGDKVGVRME